MKYATQQVTAALKAARQQKGLSQRALSKLSGVPQAHISKIESNDVDLRLSSLIGLAHALGLELALVPRMAVPAVQSLTRTVKTDRVTATVTKDLARSLQAIGRAQAALNTPELESLWTRLNEIANLSVSRFDSDIMRATRKATEAIKSGADSKPLRDARNQVHALRNAAVHSVDMKTIAPQRPAYSLEDDSDE